MNVVLIIVSAVYQMELAIVGRHEVNMQACIFSLNRWVLQLNSEELQTNTNWMQFSCYTPDKQ